MVLRHLRWVAVLGPRSRPYSLPMSVRNMVGSSELRCTEQAGWRAFPLIGCVVRFGASRRPSPVDVGQHVKWMPSVPAAESTTASSERIVVAVVDPLAAEHVENRW